eukprot:357270_1
MAVHRFCRWQCVRCKFDNGINLMECARCSHSRHTEEKFNDTAPLWDSRISDSPYYFSECGDALRISTLGYGYNAHSVAHNNDNISCAVLGMRAWKLWNTCYGSFDMHLDHNNFNIHLWLAPDTIAYEVGPGKWRTMGATSCIGICSYNPELLNTHFHGENASKITTASYGYGCDGKCYHNGIQTGNSGNGYKSGDIVTISIANKQMSILVHQYSNYSNIKNNQQREYIHRNLEIDAQKPYRLAISMKNIRHSISILNVEKTQCCDFNCPSHPSPVQQRRIIKQLGYFEKHVGDSWYVLSKKWHDHWIEYTSFRMDGADNLEPTNTMPPGPINNSDLFLYDSSEIDVVFGYIRETESDYMIPCEIKTLCLFYAATPKVKPNLVEEKSFEIVPSDIWTCFRSWYGGGPAIERKVAVTETGEKYICIWPKFIHLVFCDEQTGIVDYNNIVRTFYPDSYTLKDVVQEIDDNYMDDIGIHIWMKFRQIKTIYCMEIKVTEDDLKYEDEDRLVEVPESYLGQLSIANIMRSTDNEIVIERKRKDNTWPRAKGDDWCDTIQIGDIIDCKDTQGKFWEAMVRKVYPKGHDKEGQIIVHYIGWSVRYDCECMVQDYVFKRGTKTEGPHRSSRSNRNRDRNSSPI